MFDCKDGFRRLDEEVVIVRPWERRGYGSRERHEEASFVRESHGGDIGPGVEKYMALSWTAGPTWRGNTRTKKS